MDPQIRQNEPQTRTSRRLSRSRSLYWQSGNILLFIGLVVAVFSLLILSSNPDFDVLHSADKKTALVLTAHPDDEVMFFTPTILALVAAGWEVSALCLSTGNGDGLGDIRTKELFRSYERLGVETSRVTVLDDPRLQDGMDKHWTSSYVSQVLDNHLQLHPASIVITFDPVGITYHPNHVALAHGCSFGPRRSPGQCYALRSPSLLFKFTGPLWAVLHSISYHQRHVAGRSSLKPSTQLKRTLTVVNGPLGWLTGARAMAEHKSQLAWFRYLYFATSRLVWYNDLDELLEHG